MELMYLVQWTDQDDNGLTKLQSKTLPYPTHGYQVNVHPIADLSGALNSTYSNSGTFGRAKFYCG